MHDSIPPLAGYLVICLAGFKTVNGKEACTTTGDSVPFVKFDLYSFKTVNGKEACTTVP